MPTQAFTREQVAERARVQKLLPKESDFIGRKGYERKYRPDGSYEWRYRYMTNEKGKLTREAQEVHAMLKPFIRADSERHARNQGMIPRVKMRNAQGGIDYIDSASADSVARRTGRTHVWSVRGGAGRSVIFGPDGMGFKYDRQGNWHPTGKLGVGVFAKHASRRKVYLDPDCEPWRFADGAWRRMP